MNKFVRFLLQSFVALSIVAACFFGVDAIAQSCTTYYDHNTGRFCTVCIAPGGTPVVNCF
jgi:dolichyl-phosphate-mannose--protein O-mannosyl transferase